MITIRESSLYRAVDYFIKKISDYVNIQNILILSLYLIITNGIFLLFDSILNADRYYVVLDYFILIPLLFFRKLKILFIIGFSVIFMADILYWVRQFYPYNNLADFYELIKFIPYGPKIYWFFACLIFIWFIFTAYLSGRFYSKFSGNVRFCIFSIIIILFFKIFIFDYRGVNMSNHLKTEGLWGTMYETYNNLKYNTALLVYSAEGADFHESTLKSSFLPHLSDMSSNKIIFVLNESWGLSPEYHDIVISDLLSISDKLEFIEQGTTETVHSTILGEIRELCNLESTSVNFSAGKVEKLNHCAPNILKNKGYQTYSFHAADSRMYARNQWYPYMGLSHITFYTELVNKERCFSFPGGCDENVLNEITQTLKKNERQFIYWLTLNSHHPYSKKDIKNYTIDCDNQKFEGRQEYCRNLNLQKQFFKRLVNQITLPQYSGAEIFIVGDHPPPLLFDKKKDSFNDHVVPYIYFKIK